MLNKSSSELNDYLCHMLSFHIYFILFIASDSVAMTY